MYIDDVLSIKNLNKTKIEKKNKQTDSSASYLLTYTSILTHMANIQPASIAKRDHFNSAIINFPHFDSNIPTTPAYGVYISQLISYS